MAEHQAKINKMLALSASEASVLSVVAENPGMSEEQFARLIDGPSTPGFNELVRAVRAAARHEPYDPSWQTAAEGILRSVAANRRKGEVIRIA
jgi:hypothetical protein